VTTEAETSIIARIMATGYNRHVREHGPGGDYAGEATGSGDGHSVVVERSGSRFAVRVEQLPARTADEPKTPGQCWAALKDYLGERIDADEAVREGFTGMGDLDTARAHGALVSANRATLARMRELEKQP
jgi:hypothetical protein